MHEGGRAGGPGASPLAPQGGPRSASLLSPLSHACPPPPQSTLLAQKSLCYSLTLDEHVPVQLASTFIYLVLYSDAAGLRACARSCLSAPPAYLASAAEALSWQCPAPQGALAAAAPTASPAPCVFTCMLRDTWLTVALGYAIPAMVLWTAEYPARRDFLERLASESRLVQRPLPELTPRGLLRAAAATGVWLCLCVAGLFLMAYTAASTLRLDT